MWLWVLNSDRSSFCYFFSFYLLAQHHSVTTGTLDHYFSINETESNNFLNAGAYPKNLLDILVHKKRDSLKGKIVCKEKPRVLFVRVWQAIICWILISGRIFLARFSSVILCGFFWHTFRLLFYVSAESRLAAISSVIAQVSHSKLKQNYLSYTLVLKGWWRNYFSLLLTT